MNAPIIHYAAAQIASARLLTDPVWRLIQAAGDTNHARVNGLAEMLDSVQYTDATADLVEDIAEAFDPSAKGIMSDVLAAREGIEEDVAADGGVSPANWYGPAEWTAAGEAELERRLDGFDREWLERFAAWMTATPAFAMAAE